MAKHETPLLDQLESGPWPSFVTDIKRQAETKPECWDILGILELSYKDRITHWKHGGIVSPSRHPSTIPPIIFVNSWGCGRNTVPV